MAGTSFAGQIEIVETRIANIDLLIVHFNVDGASVTDRDRAEIEPGAAHARRPGGFRQTDRRGDSSTPHA